MFRRIQPQSLGRLARIVFEAVTDDQAVQHQKSIKKQSRGTFHVSDRAHNSRPIFTLRRRLHTPQLEVLRNQCSYQYLYGTADKLPTAAQVGHQVTVSGWRADAMGGPGDDRLRFRFSQRQRTALQVGRCRWIHDPSLGSLVPRQRRCVRDACEQAIKYTNCDDASGLGLEVSVQIKFEG